MSYINSPMYPPQKDSPSTFLLGAVIPSDTVISVASAGVLPQTTPYPLTIGIDTATTEVVLVTGINLGANTLTVTRYAGAKGWPAGSKIARVFNASDLEAIQSNIEDLDDILYDQFRETLETVESDISNVSTVVGDSNSGLVKGLADEVLRATGAETTLQTNIANSTNTLNANKINRTELPQILTDISYTASATKLTETINRYNATNQQSTSFTRDIPLATGSVVGVMTPAMFTEVGALRTDVDLKVPLARTVNNKALTDNITLTASDVSAVPTTRTVNGKALSSDVTLTASDVSAVPTTRTVNGKALSSNITLTASDVSASTSGVAATLSTTWSGSAAPYTQNVTITGMTASKNATVGLASSATASEREVARNAMLSVTAQTTNQITIAADGEKPGITIPISVILLP